MSIREKLLRELVAIREDLALLSVRVNRVYTQVSGLADSDFEVVGSAEEGGESVGSRSDALKQGVFSFVVSEVNQEGIRTQPREAAKPHLRGDQDLLR